MPGGTAVIAAGRTLAISKGGTLLSEACDGHGRAALRREASFCRGDVLTRCRVLLRADPAMGPGVATLSFGFLPYAIYLQRGSTLIVENLYMKDAPYPSLEYLNNTNNNFYGARNIAARCAALSCPGFERRAACWECPTPGCPDIADKTHCCTQATTQPQASARGRHCRRSLTPRCGDTIAAVSSPLARVGRDQNADVARWLRSCGGRMRLRRIIRRKRSPTAQVRDRPH